MRHRFLLTSICLVVVGLLAAVGLSSAEPYDFGGQTVVIQHNMTFDRLYGDNPEGLAHLDWVEKTFNVKLEWRSGLRNEDAIEPLAADIIAGNAPDLVRIDSGAMAMAALQGLVMPIDELIDEEFKTRVAPHRTTDFDSFSKVGEHYYAFSGGQAPQGTGIWWNVDLFEREGLPSPYELWKAGEWTWDAMLDIAIKATRDTDGDGVIDQWGLTDYSGFTGQGSLPVWTLASNNARSFRFDESGNVVFALDEPEAMEAFNFLYELVHVYKVVPISGVDRRAIFINGKCAMIAHRTWGAQHLAAMEEHYSWVPFPKGPRADEHRAVFHTDNIWFIPISSKYDPAALIELHYAINRLTEEYMDVTNEEHAEQWKQSFFYMYARDYESVETFEWVVANSEVYTDTYLLYFPEFLNVINAIMIQGENPATVIASIKPSMQAHLEQLFNE